jgi:hypothetical protein
MDEDRFWRVIEAIRRGILTLRYERRTEPVHIWIAAPELTPVNFFRSARFFLSPTVDVTAEWSDIGFGPIRKNTDNAQIYGIPATEIDATPRMPPGIWIEDQSHKMHAVRL